MKGSVFHYSWFYQAIRVKHPESKRPDPNNFSLVIPRMGEFMGVAFQGVSVFHPGEVAKVQSEEVGDGQQ